MTIREELALMWACTLGEKSHLNLLGKVVFFPLILLLIALWAVLTLLFERRR